jgi:hypothetical protein
MRGAHRVERSSSHRVGRSREQRSSSRDRRGVDLRRATRAGSNAFAAEVVGDKGYHKAQTLAEFVAYDLRTYISERTERQPRRWTDKPPGWRDAFHANRRRVRSEWKQPSTSADQRSGQAKDRGGPPAEFRGFQQR